MEFDLESRSIPEPESPPGYRLMAWKDSLLEAHAGVKLQSFRDGSDTAVFPSLGSDEGCHRLMQDIATRDGFIPESCWLAVLVEGGSGPQMPCGTIQAIRTDNLTGAIQNVGIVPEHRGRGIGTQLVFAALRGMRASGVRFATLEVTARNTGAVQLYSRLGFQISKTVYKPGNFAPAG